MSQDSRFGPEEGKWTLRIRTVAADLEDVGGPEGGFGEIVAGDSDDVVQAVVFVLN